MLFKLFNWNEQLTECFKKIRSKYNLDYAIELYRGENSQVLLSILQGQSIVRNDVVSIDAHFLESFNMEQILLPLEQVIRDEFGANVTFVIHLATNWQVRLRVSRIQEILYDEVVAELNQ